MAFIGAGKAKKDMFQVTFWLAHVLCLFDLVGDLNHLNDLAYHLEVYKLSLGWVNRLYSTVRHEVLIIRCCLPGLGEEPMCGRWHAVGEERVCHPYEECYLSLTDC